MALIDKLNAIGDAIRSKTGKTDKLTLDQMAEEIEGIETGTDTSDASASEIDILSGKTAYVNGEKITGTIPILTFTNVTPSTVQQVVVPTGTYCAMGAYVQGDANLVSENIAEGVSIFGVTGTHSGGSSETYPDAEDHTF